jgi:putative exosortase-associated protein (TIGR04073 family)
MKILLSVLLLTAFAAAAIADIQAPPMSQQGPARKFGRGLSNVAYGVCELPVTTCQDNNGLGNSAGWGFGVINGINRSIYRIAGGIFDVTTFPFPIYKGSYRPPYPSDLIWGQQGYTEFAPELGFETHFDYTRTYGPY